MTCGLCGHWTSVDAATRRTTVTARLHLQRTLTSSVWTKDAKALAEQGVPTMLIGTKTDILSRRQVTYAEGRVSTEQ